MTGGKPQSFLVPLKKRAEFLAVAAHRKKWVAPAFILQIAPRPADETTPPLCGFGLTASKKMIGIAVKRNRARRRLRALAQEILSLHAKPGYDFVFIAREAVLTRDFEKMRQDIEKALKHFDLWRD